jgi:hypothetical protein
MLSKTKYTRSGNVRIGYQITGDGPVDLVWTPNNGTSRSGEIRISLPRGR